MSIPTLIKLLFLSSPLALLQTPTQSIGAFITPIDAAATSSQDGAGRTARKMIDGSGWDETTPGSGIYVHSNNVSEAGSCMWNGVSDASLTFDLGKTYRVNGFYVWNYNEAGGWNSRSVKDIFIETSVDGKAFAPLGKFTLEMAPGTEEYHGQTVPFKKAVSTRYFRWKILSNYRGGEMSGISEVRFANADTAAKASGKQAYQPKYPRPLHLKPPTGSPNVVFPADSSVVDLSKPPYNVVRDGKTDCTALIQKALDDYAGRGTLYLPNGNYLISDTLNWSYGKTNNEARNVILWGQSREGVVIQLKDRCVGFQKPKKPKGLINTGHAPAQRFGNEIHNLTIDSGVGNPGACGLQFIANNQGGVYDVTIVSGDGQGVNGLDLGYTDEQGPCLIKNVSVKGFDIGVHTATGVDSVVLEHIRVESQNRFGFRNDGQPCTVRDLRSVNEVPAFFNSAGFNTLVDCEFKGVGKAGSQPAFINDSAMIARNIRTSGYRVALQNRTGKAVDFPGPNIAQFLSKPAVSLFGAIGSGLNLPIKETPEIPFAPLRQWVNALKYRTPNGDDSDAIQRAIDSGATTVYLPMGNYRIGKTILIRGSVQRIIGFKPFFEPQAPLNSQNSPVFRFVEGASPVVVVEGIDTDFSGGPYFFMEHNASRTLVMKRLAINFQAAEAYRTGPKGTGDLYIEDVVGRFFHLRKQNLWARQFNPEGDGVHFENDGGTAWVLGMKTEGGGPLLDLKNHSRTELLGSFSYTVGDSKRPPMFVIDNSTASISFGEVCFTGAPFPIIVQETQNGKRREIRQQDDKWGGHFTLFTAGIK